MLALGRTRWGPPLEGGAISARDGPAPLSEETADRL
jgi:hypothetical protein